MKCPHCNVAFYEKWGLTEIIRNSALMWTAKTTSCPECINDIIYLVREPYGTPAQYEFMVYPSGKSRPLPSEVPAKYSKVFHEANNVLPHSSAASAALSRRCLQDLLREEARVKPKNLVDEIQEVIDSNTLPSGLAESIDKIRIVGNFAAHTKKSTNTGEVIEVEKEEAEWNLDVLEELFDHYLVKPIIRKKKNDAIDKKVAESKK